MKEENNDLEPLSFWASLEATIETLIEILKAFF